MDDEIFSATVLSKLPLADAVWRVRVFSLSGFSDQSKRLTDHLFGLFQVTRGMLEAKETRFELGGCEVNAALQAKMEEFPKRRQVRFHCIGKTPDWFFGEEKAKHRADASELIVPAQAGQDFSDPGFHLLSHSFKLVPAIQSFQFVQLAKPCGHSQGIAR